MLNITAFALDVGAITPLLWGFEEREKLLEFYERPPARVSRQLFPPGRRRDMPAGLVDKIAAWAEPFPPFVDEMEGLLTTNRIWKQRTVDIGIMTPEMALAWGFTGPPLRAPASPGICAGRSLTTYMTELDFDIPVGRNGDCYDRYLVRVAEMRESMKIIKQCLARMQPGPVRIAGQQVHAADARR